MQPALGPLGPEPFRFRTSQGPSMQGPAFSPLFKVLVTVVVFGTGFWGVQLFFSGRIPLHSNAFVWFSAALLMMLYTWFCVMRSITAIEPTRLRQTWIWEKRMELGDLAYAKLIRVRGLDWLIAPRLYVRTLEGKFAVFYISDRALIAECDRLVNELREFRKF